MTEKKRTTVKPDHRKRPRKITKDEGNGKTQAKGTTKIRTGARGRSGPGRDPQSAVVTEKGIVNGVEIVRDRGMTEIVVMKKIARRRGEGTPNQSEETRARRTATQMRAKNSTER
jgi:hypothetical protein